MYTKIQIELAWTANCGLVELLSGFCLLAALENDALALTID